MGSGGRGGGGIRLGLAFGLFCSFSLSSDGLFMPLFREPEAFYGEELLTRVFLPCVDQDWGAAFRGVEEEEKVGDGAVAVKVAGHTARSGEAKGGRCVSVCEASYCCVGKAQCVGYA